MRLMYFTYHKLLKNWRIKTFAASTLQMLGARHIVLRLDITSACNLKCKMCYLSGANQTKTVRFSPEQITRIAEQLFSKTKLIYLSCGFEPFMSKNFELALSLVRKYKVPYSVAVTNGQLLNREKIEMICRLQLSELIVSLDSPVEKTYNSIRSTGKEENEEGGQKKRTTGFNVLIKNLKELNEYKRKNALEKPALRFNVTLMRENIEELPDLINFASEMGVNVVHARHMDYFPEAIIDFGAQTLFNHAELANAKLEEARSLAKQKGMFLDAPAPIPSEFTEEVESDYKFACPYPWFQVMVRMDGTVAPCTHWTEESLGNVFEDNFEEIWKNNFGELRRNVLKGKIPSSCVSCSINGGAKDIQKIFHKKWENTANDVGYEYDKRHGL